ncbi:MAG: GNAT family N-acetyltransferase [Clostridiales bacterium]|nr:GNAT family N-acetyltransferase [Clostridiales bacterium]
MKIRHAVLEDLDAISAVESKCFPAAEAASKEDFKKRLTVYPNHFWLLEEEGMILSFINGMVTDEMILKDEMYENASLHKENGNWQMIFGVNTIPQYRKQGLAAQLMNVVIADAKKQGRKGLVLTCKAERIHYYKKFGFQNKGISKSTHGGVIWYDMRLEFASNILN